MKRQNFYLLLDLSVDPAENDQKVIAQALKKKQALWSKLRTHPTKGTHAKQNIGFIPEIRRVMADPELREKEALAAKKILKKREEKKYFKIDEQIRLLVSKGNITDMEAERLADLNSIDREVILNRSSELIKKEFQEIDIHINKFLKRGSVTKKDIKKFAKQHSVKEDRVKEKLKLKRKENLAEIEAYINIRMVKGYVEAGEIASLADFYSVEKGTVLRFVKCPVRKKGDKKAVESQAMDETVYRVINDNLKIIGKSSLYDFLGLWLSSGLEELQGKAKAIETQIRKVGIKNAAVTASEALAGHCLTVFMTPESRNAYDVSREKNSLINLNTDIDIAGFDGKIYWQYFDILIKKAMGAGVNPEDAFKYIKQYSADKGWSFTKKPKKKNTQALVIFASVLAVILIAGAFFTYSKLKEQRIFREYNEALLSLKREKTLEKKEQILNDFIKLYQKGKYRSDAQSRLNNIKKSIVKRDFTNALAGVVEFEKTKEFEKALDVCRNYLKIYPQSLYTGKIKKKISELSKNLDDKNYENLKNAALKNCFEKIALFDGFLKKYPKNKHLKDVKNMILQLEDECYYFLKDQLILYEKQENWKECHRLCSIYTEFYKHKKFYGEIKNYQTDYRNKVWATDVFNGLKDQALSKKDDYTAAKQIYIDYLKKHPEPFLKKMIINELLKVEKNEKLAKIRDDKNRLKILLNKIGKDRYIENPKGIVYDKKTGLMWCLFDSQIEKAECLDYESAVTYAAQLKTGGYTDWRLPGAKELQTIYKTKPFFPVLEIKWYWSTDKFRRFSERWVTTIDVVNSSKEIPLEKEQKDSLQCGSVRAVRP